MKVLVIGSGGREHALVWKISQSPAITELFCAPGNPGIEAHARCIQLNATSQQDLLKFARSERIDLTVVGPEQPLAEGIVDLFEEHGMSIFGPTRLAAQLEWSKAFAKEFMNRHQIPTASYRTFDHSDLDEVKRYMERVRYPMVLKADGLAAGKGVVICNAIEEARTAVREIMQDGMFGSAGKKVLIEEFLTGEEASVFAICDGKEYVTMIPAQDYKRVFDGDRGKNTGGMGSYAPAPVVTGGILDAVRKQIIEPTLRGMQQEGRLYKGCLYVGLMITEEGPKVVEFNSRFGDPETQVVLPLFNGDFLGLLHAASRGEMAEWKSLSAATSSGAAACVILASKGYPDAYSTGKEIRGIEKLSEAEDVMVFHAGTSRVNATLRTAGGRVLGVTAFGSDWGIERAVNRAYEAVRNISFEGMHFRKDIGLRALKRQELARC